MSTIIEESGDPMDGFEVESEIADLDTILQAEIDATDASQEVSCDLPHWRVNRNELIQIMNIAKSFPIKTALVFGFRLEKDNAGKPRLHIHYDNRDSTIEANIPILNDDFHELDTPFFIEGNTLYQLIGAYPNFVFAFDADNKLYFWSNFSQVKLESHNLNWDSLVKGIPHGLNYMPFPMNREQVITFKTLFGAALKQSDNVLLIDRDHVEAYFSLFLYKLNKSTDALDFNFVLRKIDLFPLVELFSLGGDVQFAVDNGMVYFKWINGHLFFKMIPYQEKNFMYPKTFSSGATSGDFTLDVALIKKALRISQFMKALAISFVGDGNGKIIASPKPGVKFEVGVGDLSDEGFTLVCDNLLRLINTISDKEVTVKMLVTDTGIELIVNNPQSPVEVSLSRMSTAQHRRDESTKTKVSDRQKQIDNLAAKGIHRDTKRPADGGSFADQAGVNINIDL